MRNLVIGTAGHIDHGKTSLVRAMTGVDTDRWQEEQERGITIDLGFAHLDLAPDLRASIVDVPGHERFVKNMVAGTGGIDLVMLCIAADEGVMPQTREHLDICRLLGVRHGLVALTKMDLVEDPEWVEMVGEEIHKEVADSFLADCPILPVSAKDGRGLDELAAALEKLGRSLPQRNDSGQAFLAIDRAFSMKGFGTVVTGTLVSGALHIDQEVDVLPDASHKLRRLKVRGLQSHGQQMERAGAGQRLAVNLSGVERQALHRGQVLVESDSLEAGAWVEGDLQVLPGAKPIRDRAVLTLHTGTAKTQARIQLVDGDKLAPGGKGLVRIRFEDPLAVLPRQRYLLRGTSSIKGRGPTLAGGGIRIIFPPRRRKKDKEAWIAELKSLRDGDPQAALLAALKHLGSAGGDLAALAMRSGLSIRQVERTLERLLQSRQVFKFDRERGRYLSAQVLERMIEASLTSLQSFHGDQPMLPGMPTEQLRSSMRPPPEARVFRLMAQEMLRRTMIVQEQETTRLADHKVRLDAKDSAAGARILARYAEAGLKPPRLQALAEELESDPKELQELLQHWVREGKLLHITGDMFADRSCVEKLRERLEAHLDEHEAITTQQFKEMVGATRKHVIPLAEYFDRLKVTMRVGEKRVRRGRKRGG